MKTTTLVTIQNVYHQRDKGHVRDILYTFPKPVNEDDQRFAEFKIWHLIHDLFDGTHYSYVSSVVTEIQTTAFLYCMDKNHFEGSICDGYEAVQPMASVVSQRITNLQEELLNGEFYGVSLQNFKDKSYIIRAAVQDCFFLKKTTLTKEFLDSFDYEAFSQRHNY